MTDVSAAPRSTRLRKSNPLGKGFRRVRSGTGFSYKDLDGTTLHDPQVRARLEALAIPPAWQDVWIAPYENGHIQAVGFDAANRKQYIYHPTWAEKHARRKFERMLQLAEALPSARRRVTRHLHDEGLSRRRVLAAAFRLLDLGGLRIGSERYEDENGSRGLATLLTSDVQIDGAAIRLTFPAKSHKTWDSTIKDADLAAVLAELQQRVPGERLLQFEDDGQWHHITPQDVNRYVKKRTGGRFSAKDFRTLRGSVTAAASLARHGPESGKSKQQRAIAEAMRAAAAVLSNTPTIAKASYVDPRVVDRFRAGETIDPARPKAAEQELLSMLFQPPDEPVSGTDAG
ncbi:DNA topoisomerase IB [uncultured Amnibacterium sp.]|uniref:DNA topoisomerase IB n=1 Tax=uncultured Amnibacterium sp. TaxID=1631851 RepID=UPI0035CB2993